MISKELSEIRTIFDGIMKRMSSCYVKKPFDVYECISVFKQTVEFLKETPGSVLFRPRMKILFTLKKTAVDLLSFANQTGVSGKRLATLTKNYFAIDYQIIIKTYEAKLALIGKDFKKFTSGRKKRSSSENELILSNIEKYFEDLREDVELDLSGENILGSSGDISETFNAKKLRDEKKLKSLFEEISAIKEKMWLVTYEDNLEELENIFASNENLEELGIVVQRFIKDLKMLNSENFSAFSSKVKSVKFLGYIYIEMPEMRRELISSMSSKDRQKRVLSISIGYIEKELKRVETLLPLEEKEVHKLSISLSIAKLSDFFGYMRGHISHRNLLDKKSFKHNSNKFESLLKKIALDSVKFLA